jgi:hypothetical protein
MTIIRSQSLLPRAIQFKLELRDRAGAPARWTRPLGDLNAAMRDLDMSDEEVVSLIGSTTEHSRLIGFNIATDPKGRQELRVLTRSIEHFRESRAHAQLKLSWEEIFRLIFPRVFHNGRRVKKFLTGLDVKAGLNCTQPHVTSLGQYFTLVTEGGQGRGNTPVYATDSVETWLKGRQL